MEKSWHGALGADFRREKPQHAVKLDVVSRYMFTMAMENDDLNDWVTEKVWLVCCAWPLVTGPSATFTGISSSAGGHCADLPWRI